MNKINQLFENKKKNILSIFFTAGYPKLESTGRIIQSLEKNGADLIEVGIPYSDPLADGPVIQATSSVALANGMNMNILFNQINEIKNSVTIPLILMGYLNPILQYGIEKFCTKAKECGISGVIIPDLPIDEYNSLYKSYFEESNLKFIFLITPNTSIERIQMIDNLSEGFIYAVSSSSTTGKELGFSNDQKEYLNRLNSMKLKNPIVVGFGIHNKETLQSAWEHANGAIIGSAYLKKLSENSDIEKATAEFFEKLK
ncbi:MAG: tryptophan synthase subunit alpha [Bacteroidales bacterium]|nr:MAG: tryptophan synthase subunit alpha [Bacteroidales bacterium]